MRFRKKSCFHFIDAFDYFVPFGIIIFIVVTVVVIIIFVIVISSSNTIIILKFCEVFNLC